MDTPQTTSTKLPEDITAMLLSDEFVEKIELIGEKQSLPAMEQGFLVRICANLLRGKLHPSGFVKTLTEELDIPREKAAFIAQEINRDVFSSVKDSLKELHQVETAANTPLTPITPTPEKASTPSVTHSIPATTVALAAPTPVMPAAPQQMPTTPAAAVPMTPAPTAQPASTATIPTMKVMPTLTPTATKAPEEKASSMGSIFEQKLSGTFRMGTDDAHTGGTPGVTPTPPKATPAPSIMFTPSNTGVTPPTTPGLSK